MPVLRNARHERFAQNKAKGMSIGPAYTAAGYKAKDHSAEVNGARLLRNAEVQNRIVELMAPAVEATQATVERVLKEMVRLAFYDMTAILDSTNGRIAMKDPRELSEDLRRATGYTQYGRFAGVSLAAGGQQHQVLLGRTFLRAFIMIYDGLRGQVTLAI